MVRRIGIALGLETEAGAEAVHAFFRPCRDAAVEEVAGVELDAGFGGLDRKDAAAGRISNGSREFQRALVAGGPVVIIAACAFELKVVRADALVATCPATSTRPSAIRLCKCARENSGAIPVNSLSSRSP